jgi:hypothetical protein
MWVSKKKYRLEAGVGHIIQMGTGFVIDVNNRKFLVSSKIGDSIKAVEEATPSPGRPTLFSEPGSMKGITLPESTWKKIGEPFSLNIAILLDKIFKEDNIC